ncbi:MAG TPA: hypothetical protein VII99_05415 [Bacteroidia bacterium]
MPALNVTVPQYPRAFDLKDAVDAVDRQLETIQATVALAQQNSRGIGVDPTTNAAYSANTMPRPAYITSAGGITAYEAAVTAALTALTTAYANLASINSLS